MSAVEGGITVGQLSVFLSYASQYAKPFNEISGVVTELQNSLACASRVFSLIDADSEIAESQDAEVLSADGHVCLSDVSFRYIKSRPLIDGLNLDVKPGQRIAIVGPTGCGKTTLINLLMRFMMLTAEVFQYRDMIYAMLRVRLYELLTEWFCRKHGSNRELYMRISHTEDRGASRNEVETTACAAHAHSFIKRLPNGYDTVISEGGDTLSQGQKQLLCIARVMLVLPPMLILDEATSSIDTRAEIKIQSAFFRNDARKNKFYCRASSIYNTGGRCYTRYAGRTHRRTKETIVS